MLKPGRLADALRRLSVDSGVDILFSSDIVGDRRNPSLDASGSVQSILTQLLAGTGLTFRQLPAGAVVIIAATPAPAEPIAVPEVLVIARRSQNVDIARSTNDIQPYDIIDQGSILASHTDNLGDFFQTRLANNAEPQSPAVDPAYNFASNRSEVNLYGLGPNQTLVLVDGARMPGIVAIDSPLQFYQTDLNGIPPAAVDRVESLTGTAGGIYGPGATAGVINVVLKRDYSGTEAGVTSGITDRGDGARWRFDGRVGFTPDNGATDIMAIFSHSQTDAIEAGQRSYGEAARELEYAEAPSTFFAGFPTVNGILFSSLDGAPLSLRSSLGGATLGSNYTYLPLSFAGTAGDLASTLAANSGQLPSLLSADGNGALRSLTMGSTIDSTVLNVRHRFSDRVEAFVDFIGYENVGRARAGDDVNVANVLSTLAPNNPFNQNLVVTFPLPGFDTTFTNRIETARLSAGVIVHLPASWTGEASYSFGEVHQVVRNEGFELNSDFFAAFGLDRPGAKGEPAPNPMGSSSAFYTALQAYKQIDDLDYESLDRMQDETVRFAGPLFSWRGRVVSLSMTAENRQETVPAAQTIYFDPTETPPALSDAFGVADTSGSAELRAPIFLRDANPWILRGLELQLALRYDDDSSSIPSNGAAPASQQITIHQTTETYTAGFRVFPLDHLLLRASVATGILPPTPDQLLQSSVTYPISIPGVTDPERGGQPVGTGIKLIYGGSPSLQPEWAQTVSAGFVINPEGGAMPRLSLDWTHLEKSREISNAYGGDVAYFVENESTYPGRVVRAPLTAADAALGYTGGVITQVDTSALNIGSTIGDMIDLRADYQLRVTTADSLRLYASVSWEPRLARTMAPALPSVSYVGFEDGPLPWRGNAGVEWVRGPLAVGLNGQFYAPYYDVDAEDAVAGSLDAPGVHIPAQFYIDLDGRYQLRLQQAGLPTHNIELRFGVENLFDQKPPLAINNTLGFSYYGDPRGRRFEVSATAHF